MSEIPIVVCVDDTDDITKETSTGAVAEAIAQKLMELGGQLELEITRHQLLLNPGIAYTSHNSSMAFVARLEEDLLETFHDEAVELIMQMRSQESDPGFCIGKIPFAHDAYLDKLIDFGFRAKQEVLSMEQAFALAEEIPWLTLEELGGTGDGVIGALAGVGLRLSGNDGRFRGKWDLAHEAQLWNARKGAIASEEEGERPVASVKELLEILERRVKGKVAVIDEQGHYLASEAPVQLCDKAKPLLRHGSLVVVTRAQDGINIPLNKKELDALGEGKDIDAKACSSFETDNDVEELIDDVNVIACSNCLYRRLTQSGFICMNENAEY